MSDLDISLMASRLRAAHARRRRVDLSALWALSLSGLMLSFSAFFILDYLTRFPAPARLAMSAALLAFFLLALPLWGARRGARKPELLELAKEVERKASSSREGFKAVLVSAAEFASKGQPNGSAELRANVVAQSGAPEFDPSQAKLHDAKRLSWSLRLLAAFAIVYVAWAAFGHDALLTFFKRAAGLNDRYMTRTRILKVEAPKSGPQYVSIPIKVDAAGALPAKGSVSLAFDGEPPFEIPLERQAKDSGAYACEVRTPAKSFSFSVKLGDDQTQELYVSIVRPPGIESAKVSIKPPAYSGLKERALELSSFEMLEGSKLQFEIVPDKELASCSLELGKSKIEGAKSGKAYVFKDVEPKDSAKFSVRLVDKDGVDNFDRVQYSITVLRDRAPEISITAPENGAFYAPSSSMKWSMKASDDYGICRIELRYSITKKLEKGELVETVKVRDGSLKLADFDKVREASPAGSLPLKELNLEPGQSVELKAVAFDAFPGRKDDELGTSLPVTVNIVSAEELRRIIEEEALQVHQLLKDVSSDMKRQKTAIDMMQKKEAR